MKILYVGLVVEERDVGYHQETGKLMEMFNGIEVMHFDDAPTWEAWLATHHQKQEGIWVEIAAYCASCFSQKRGDSGISQSEMRSKEDRFCPVCRLY